MSVLFIRSNSVQIIRFLISNLDAIIEIYHSLSNTLHVEYITCQIHYMSNTLHDNIVTLSML